MVRVVSTKILSRPSARARLLDSLQYPFAVALALDLRRYRERRHFPGLAFRIRIERGAAEYHAVVLDDGVVADVALDLRPVALDQRAVALERLDQLQHAADVVGVAWRRLSSFSSTTIVPMPSCVNTSMRSDPSIANGRMCERSTPPRQARTQWRR
jgi:hypothetical protein